MSTLYYIEKITINKQLIESIINNMTTTDTITTQQTCAELAKADKVDYIYNVQKRFTEAENHGHNGSNWWDPTANTIAYNVKMRVFGGIESDAIAKMSDIQKMYYNDKSLERAITEYYDSTLLQASYDLIQDIKDTGKSSIKEVNFAGRSGGWVEVTYYNNIEDIEDVDDSDMIDDVYQEALKLEKLENDISTLIEDSHKKLSDYIESDDYVSYFVHDYLKADDEILDEIADDYKKSSDIYKAYQSLEVTTV
jgi:hypothetical protein